MDGNVKTRPAVYMGGESQVAQYGEGELAMLMRVRGDFVDASGTAPRAVDHNHALSTSSDGGVTWSNASLLPIQSVYCEGSLVGTSGGALLLSAPSTNNGGRANLTVWASRREGNTTLFDYVTTLYKGGAAYSSMVAALMHCRPVQNSASRSEDRPNQAFGGSAV